VLAKAGGGRFGIRRPSQAEDIERMMSMKRALMFLLLGPALVVVPWLIFIAAIDGLRGPVDIVATLLFLFTFLVATIAGLVDGCLARALPIRLRTLMTASVGAITAWILAYAFFTGIFSSSTSTTLLLMSFALGGAIVMGACALLSSDYGDARGPSIVPAGPGESGWPGLSGIRHSLS
jgi:hypothetical protein